MSLWFYFLRNPHYFDAMRYHTWRVALVILFLLLGVLLHVMEGIQAAWYLYAGALILIASYFLFGTVWAAYQLLNRGNVLEAEQTLLLTRYPQWLIGRNRTYYYLVRGLIHLQHKEISDGEAALFKTLAGNLRSRDRALALLNLAHVAFVRKDHSGSLTYMKQAKALGVDDLLVRQQLELLEKALKGR